MIALAALARPDPASAFALVTPKDGVVVRPGQSVLASVDLGSDVGMARVDYYWYRQEEEPLPRQLARASFVATATSVPPYGGMVPVPRDAIGRMRLLAVGEVARGRLGIREEFDEITVQVEPEAALLSIEFEVEKPWRLDTIGKILEPPVVGQFADGVLRRLGGDSTGSRYESSDVRVLQVLSVGLVRVAGNGRAVLTVENRGKRATLDVVVRSGEEPNEPPVALAGPDLTVTGGAKVVLNGLQSRDPDGDALHYEWTQVSGNKVSLLDPNTPHPSFVAPRVSARRLLRFRLRVTDMKGPDTLGGADSPPAYVSVWVEP